MKANTWTRIAVIAVIAALFSLPAFAQNNTEFRVTITNLTKGQIFSPPLVVSHSRDVAVFQSGSPALPELGILAEDGDPAPLRGVLDTLPQVFETAVAGGPVLPGQTVTVLINARFPYDRISAVGMLIQTNDAFFGLNSVEIPERRMRGVYSVPAYDAGTEANNELCAFIPGPPCGSGGVRDTADAEGYVYINNGITGIGDLEPSEFTWLNPSARITIRRTR
ncbi:MAG: spondin domain-containing protein [Acidobacteriota bacterium]